MFKIIIKYFVQDQYKAEIGFGITTLLKRTNNIFHSGGAYYVILILIIIIQYNNNIYRGIFILCLYIMHNTYVSSVVTVGLYTFA
jgi:hypothetical protein